MINELDRLMTITDLSEMLGVFGTDYFTRTAVAKSNIFVNGPVETKHLYQDLYASGARRDGAKRYRVTFANGQTPPVRGFGR